MFCEIKKIFHLFYLITITNHLKEFPNTTGWSISFLYTLTGLYDNNDICTKKIVVGTRSVHREISFQIINFEISELLLSKKLVLKLRSILAQNSTYNFEVV